MNFPHIRGTAVRHHHNLWRYSSDQVQQQVLDQEVHNELECSCIDWRFALERAVVCNIIVLQLL